MISRRFTWIWLTSATSNLEKHKMIITLRSLVSKVSELTDRSAVEGQMGRKPATAQDWNYSKVAMWGVLFCSGALAIAGLAICIVSAARDRTIPMYGGMLLLMIGTYLMVA